MIFVKHKLFVNFTYTLQQKQVFVKCFNSIRKVGNIELKALFVVFEPIFADFVKYHIGILYY